MHDLGHGAASIMIAAASPRRRHRRTWGLSRLVSPQHPLEDAAGPGLALRLVFGRRGLLRAEHHGHVAAVLLGPLLDDREVAEILREAVEDHLPALRMGHLAA